MELLQWKNMLECSVDVLRLVGHCREGADIRFCTAFIPEESLCW